MKFITNLEKISPALAKARSRGVKPFNSGGNSPKKLAKMVGENRSSNPNPRAWQKTARYALMLNVLRPHEDISMHGLIVMGVACVIIVLVCVYNRRNKL